MKLTTVALVLSTAGIAAEVPKTWDERALADWATPVAGLNVRPGHFSEREYYADPAEMPVKRRREERPTEETLADWLAMKERDEIVKRRTKSENAHSPNCEHERAEG